MGKVLRKVKCSDRLPEKSGGHYVETINGYYDYYTFDKESHNNEFIWIDAIKYWYEEIDLEELIKEAFDAGRELVGSALPNTFVFDTFEDYLKSLNNQK